MQSPTMWGAGALTVRSLCAHECFWNNKVTVQSIRWKRKPIWLPTAKSKVFRVPERPVIPEEDKAELFRLHAQYKTYTNSIIYNFSRTQHEQEKLLETSRLHEANWANEFSKSKEINDEWNRAVAAEREIRLENERQKRIEYINKSVMKEKELKEQQMAQIEEEVSSVLAEADSYITEKNIDAAIDEALNTVVNYNYCIDIHGTIHKEDFAFLESNKDQKKEAQAQ